MVKAEDSTEEADKAEVVGLTEIKAVSNQEKTDSAPNQEGAASEEIETTVEIR